MATFEFGQGASQTRLGATAGSTTQIVFNETVGPQTVTFTFSITDPAVSDYIVSHSPGGAGFINVSNVDAAGDIYSIALVDTADASLNRFGETAGGNITVKASIFSTAAGVWNVQFVGTAGTFTDTVSFGNNTASAVTDTIGEVTNIVFTTSTVGGFLALEQISANVVCFFEDTGIATPTGDVAVEALRPGDEVLRADGAPTRVKWIGKLPVDPRLVHPNVVNPICIRAGALGDGLPRRDLYVSGDHAIELDGALYNAGALVNGRSIYQVSDIPLEPFTYYHVETERHELLLAEGCPAESFIDYAGRDTFANADGARGGTIAEMDMPRISTPRLVPERIRAFLAQRADAVTRRAA